MLAWVKSELNGVHSQIYLEEVLSVWSPSNIPTGKLVYIYEILCCWVLRYFLMSSFSLKLPPDQSAPILEQFFAGITFGPETQAPSRRHLQVRIGERNRVQPVCRYRR